MTAASLDWLKRPTAHRGLHDSRRGIVENSASAIRAAIAAGYAIEVDLQCARDGLPIVFHDETLDRLTPAEGPVREQDAASLSRIGLRDSKDRILTVPELLTLVDGHVPLLIEVKSDWGRDPRYAENIGKLLSGYAGKLAIMSFDHNLIASFRSLAPGLPRGLISERFEGDRARNRFSPLERFAMRHLLTAAIARPDFIAYDVRALPAVAPSIARFLGLPLIAWTVRDEAGRTTASRYADAMIFEGMRP